MAKKTYRLPPCPSYDVERLESWLQDMAKEGLMLEKEGEFFGFLAFTRTSPQAVRYRLEPKPKKDGESSLAPDEEARQIAAEFGWEFIDVYGNFYIYRSADPHAREMNTDLSVQAAALKTVKRNFFLSLIGQTILSAETLVRLAKEPFRHLVTFDWLYPVLFLILAVSILISDIRRIVHIRQLQKKLKNSIPLDHNKPWKPVSKFHHAVKFGYLLLLILFVSIIISSCTSVMTAVDTAVSEYPGDPPFVTLEDLAEGGTFTPENVLDLYNVYTPHSTACAPEILEWWEHGTLVTSDGTVFEGATLIVNYYETASAWIARGLADDFLRRAQDEKHYQELDAPELDIDYVFSYQTIYPTLLMRHGNILIEAEIHITNEEGDSLLLTWAELQAARMKGEE